MGPAVTVIVTLSDPDALSGSLAVNSKTSVALAASCVGAVKRALAELALDRLTVRIPDDCRQEYDSVSPSRSVALPAKVTTSPSFTVRSLPALALGERFPGVTVTIIVSVPDALRASVTVSSKVRLTAVVRPVGAVKLALAVLALDRTGDGVPDDCRQEYDSASFSGSVPLPERVTFAPIPTVWSLPALAVGASLAPAVTVIVTLSVSDAPRASVTVSSKTRLALDTSWAGAVKRAVARLALDRLTLGVPDDCRQE